MTGDCRDLMPRASGFGQATTRGLAQAVDAAMLRKTSLLAPVTNLIAEVGWPIWPSAAASLSGTITSAPVLDFRTNNSPLRMCCRPMRRRSARRCAVPSASSSASRALVPTGWGATGGLGKRRSRGTNLPHKSIRLPPPDNPCFHAAYQAALAATDTTRDRDWTLQD
jgi:hypothetical protein